MSLAVVQRRIGMRMRFGLLVAALAVAATVCVTALAGSQAPPGVTKTKFVIGGTFPLSGAASYYAPIPVGMKVYFTYINTRRGKDHKRGVSGRQIVWKYYDDGYRPPDTIGWQPDYLAEGTIYGKYAATAWPTKKIGVIYQSDDYGKNYLEGFKKGLGSKASNIIISVGVGATDSSVAQQVGQLKASGAAVIAIFATPSPTVKTFATMKAFKFKPEQTILNSVSANDTVMGLALANSDETTLDGTISTSYLINSNDPKYASNASVKLYKAQMKRWAPQADPQNTFYYYGFAKAYDVVRLLAATGKNPTRAKLLYAARHMNWTNPFALPGVKVKTSSGDPFPISQVKLIRFNGNTKIWTEFGSLLNGRGGT